MIRLKQFSTLGPGTALGSLAQQTHAIQGAVAKSMVGQGHRHLLDNTRGLEQQLLSPVSQRQASTTQDKGHQLQAWMHLSRIDSALETFDKESRTLIGAPPNAHTSLHNLTQRNDRVTARLQERKALLDRRAAWETPTPPPSSALDPITLPALPAAPINTSLPTKDLEKAFKHVNASDEKIARLDSYIKKQPLPMPQAEEDIFIAQRNAETEYRNAWATGRMKGTSRLKSNMGLNSARKSQELELERSRQLAPLELAIQRLDRTVEAARRSGLEDHFPPGSVSTARDAITRLITAIKTHSLDGSSSKGMNPEWILTSRNKQRLELEQDVFQKGFVQLNVAPRTEKVGSTQSRLDFNNLIHSSAAMHLKHAAINQLKEDNQHRAQIAELNTDLHNIYTELTNNLALSQITKPRP